MTLRVTIEIIPFGEEDKARTIDVFNISNIGRIGFDECGYMIERNEYKTGKKDLVTLVHNQTDGALVLVKKVLEKTIG